MIRRYEYPVTVRLDRSLCSHQEMRDFLIAGITNSFVSSCNVEVTVGEPVDITPKSAADRAEAVLVDAEMHPERYTNLDSPLPVVTPALIAALRAAVGEDTP